MQLVWKNKFIIAQILTVVFLKLVLAYPTSGLIGLAGNVPLFSGKEVVVETNKFRSSLNLSALQENVTLNKSAKDKLGDMIAGQYFAHISPTGTDPWHWLAKNNYNYTAAGENLAVGFFDARETVQAWIDSPSHRKNLSDTRFQEIGVATSLAKIGELEGIVVVQVFGRPTTQKVIRPSPTPKITVAPAPIITVTTTPSPEPSQPIATAVPNPKPKEAPLLLTYVSAPSDTPVEEPQATKVYSAIVENSSKVVKTLDTIFIFYAGIISLISIFLLIKSSARRDLWLRTLIHVTIFLIALLAPPLIYAGTALIL